MKQKHVYEDETTLYLTYFITIILPQALFSIAQSAAR